MASEKREPVGRREPFSFVHNGQFYVGHGDSGWLKAARDQGKTSFSHCNDSSPLLSGVESFQ